MWDRLGQVVAPPDVSAEAFLRAIPPLMRPLGLTPSSDQGWFGGRSVVVWSPGRWDCGVGIEEAGTALDVAFDSQYPTLTATLLSYDGTACVLTYTGGVVLEDEGWRAWGHAQNTLMRPCPEDTVAVPAHEPLISGAATDVPGSHYRRGVARVREAVEAGEVYVLNLTYLLRGIARHDPVRTFRVLRERAPAEMAALLVTPEWSLASVSPERFVSVVGNGDGRKAQICPIKGTRPRGGTAMADELLAAELLADAKERAEHTMIVDLERNDLGRVCVPGTVDVDPLTQVVPTPYCHHMVSTVQGTLAEDVTISDVLHATFPCGSVTGAPKVAAMDITEDLEAAPRGAYTGSLVVAVPGHVDSSVIIRSAVMHVPDGGGSTTVTWGTGCGITYESDASQEWLESLLKCAPLLGDGSPETDLLETCRVVGGSVPLLARHLARLASGGCGQSLLAVVRERLADELSRASDGVVRARITVRSTGTVAVELREDLSPLALADEVTLLPVVTSSMPPLPKGAAKPADREIYDQVQAEATEQGFTTGLLVGPEGRVIDGATSSVWIRDGDQLLTPRAPSAVAGVAREIVFDHAHESGFFAAERELMLSDIEAADEVFLSNAMAGVVAVGAPGDAAKALGVLFDRIWSTPEPGA